MALAAPPARRRHTFVPLPVVDVDRLTDESVAITFGLPDDPELADAFLSFAAGQHLTLRATINGEEVRQSYSLCLAPSVAASTGTVRVAAARVAGGRMSTWLNEQVRVGDVIEVLPPLGSFTCPTEPAAAKHHVFIAAGSGITPILALISAVLEQEPLCRATLLYGNRSTATVMFLEELEDLKNAHVERFQLVHVLSREATDVELFHGRLDAERIPRLLNAFAPTAGVHEWYLCGPHGMVEDATAVLREAGVEAGQIHHEVFHVPSQEDDVAPVVVDTSAPPEAIVTVNLDGRSSRIEMPTRAESILAATLRVRPDAPYSCTGGVCGTCRARVVRGEVRMDRNFALEPEEIAHGIVLACQAHPVSDEVQLDYDA